MKLLLKAVRTELTGDATLTTTVPANDITGSYNAESANYPSISLGISDGGSGFEVPGVTQAELSINIFSKVNKQQLWEIYALVKGLLHNQERSVTTADRLIHLIFEKSVDGDMYDLRDGVWRLTAKYGILYTTSSVAGTTNVNGLIYADSSNVTATGAKEVAKVRGLLTLEISYTEILRTEQERFAKSIYFGKGSARLRIEEAIFEASIFNKVFGITANASDTLADDSTAATSYTVVQSTVPPNLQILFQLTKTDDGKKLEIEADKAVCLSTEIPFSRKDFVIHNCEWLFLGDSSGNIVKVSVEN